MRLKDKIDMRYVKVCVYAAVTLLAVIAGAMLLNHSGAFFATLWSLIGAVLAPMVFGAIISYLLHPVVARIDYALSAGTPDSPRGRALWAPSVLITLALVLGLLVVIIMLILLVITRSISGISIENVIALWDRLRTDFADFFKMAEGMVGNLGLSSSNLGETATSFVASLGGAVATIGFSIIFAMYFLLDGPRLGEYFKRVARAITRGRFDDKVALLASDADRIFTAYIRGQIVDAFILGALISVALSIVGVPYGPVIGVFAFVGNLIPGFGGPIAIATTALVCVTQGEYQKLIIGVIAIGLLMMLEAYVINPRLMKNNLELHPLVIIAALIAGGAAGGVAGMLVAVPVGALLKLNLDRWLELREREGAGPNRGE